MNARDVTLLNMATRAIRDDPARREQYLEQFSRDRSPELRKAMNLLRTRLQTAAAGRDAPDFSYASMAGIIRYASGQSEVEKAVIASLRCAVTSRNGG